MVLHHRSKIIQNSLLVKKKLNLTNQQSLFLVHNAGTKFSQTCCFHKIIAQNNIYKKPFPKKASDKTLKEGYWTTVPIVQVNQDAGTLIFIP